MQSSTSCAASHRQRSEGARRRHAATQSMFKLSGWERVSTLMPGHTISRQKDWWETGNQVATKITDQIDLWSRKPQHSETLRRAMKGAESESVLHQLAWATIHDEVRLKHYFSTGQAAHLRGAEGTVVCTDGSVHLDVLENGHTKALLGEGIAADAYQAEEGGAEIALTRQADEVLWWGCDTKALLQGLQAWQSTIFHPSPDNHQMLPVLQTVVEKAARQTRQTHEFWLKAHAGMGLNEEADISMSWYTRPPSWGPGIPGHRG
eukprot:227011-Rhodomonas_salina.2